MTLQSVPTITTSLGSSTSCVDIYEELPIIRSRPTRGRKILVYFWRRGRRCMRFARRCRGLIRRTPSTSASRFYECLKSMHVHFLSPFNICITVLCMSEKSMHVHFMRPSKICRTPQQAAHGGLLHDPIGRWPQKVHKA